MPIHYVTKQRIVDLAKNEEYTRRTYLCIRAVNPKAEKSTTIWKEVTCKNCLKLKEAHEMLTNIHKKNPTTV